MNSVFILKEYLNPDCNYSLTIGVYKNREDAIAERDRLRASYPERTANLEWGVYSPRLLIDVVEYDIQ